MKTRTVCVLLEVCKLFSGKFALRLAHGCGGREAEAVQVAECVKLNK